MGPFIKIESSDLGLQKLHICPKVTKMGSISGHRIDYNGVGPCHLVKQCLACTNRTVTFPLGSISAISRVRSLILPEERRGWMRDPLTLSVT